MKNISKINQRKTFIIFLIFSLFLFLFLRLYRLPNSLNFFGDIGRDFTKLQTWQQTGKPPLLGPMTSVISFNQSAIYFYFLMPFYLITQGSVFATTIATITLFLVSLGAGLYFFKENQDWQQRLLIIFYLIAINPVFVEHHRYVWNPSLIAPFLINAFFLLLLLTKKYSRKTALFFSLSLATAVSLNYSVVPTVFVIWLASLWGKTNKQKLEIFLLSLGSGLLLNLPTLFFELRHGFFLTKKLPSQELLQKSVTLATKLHNFAKNLLSLPAGFKSEIILAIFLLLIFGIITWANWQLFHKKKKKVTQEPMFIASISLITSIFLTLLTPFKMHSHYLYGIFSLLFITIAFLPKKIMLFLVSLLTIVWLHPYHWSNYFQETEFTVQEKKNCIEKIYQSIHEPIYFNLNAGSHNHQALGYIYLANKLGYKAVSAIDQPLVNAKYMVVFSENAEFVSGKTDYYELSLFSNIELHKSIDCSENLTADLFVESN